MNAASVRLLKKAHLRRCPACALVAAYLEYAWTHLRWVPRASRGALHLGLFEQPERKRVVEHPAMAMARVENALIDYVAPPSGALECRRLPLQLPLFDLLVLCCACSRLKTDRGKWSKHIVRASDYPDTDFSHGICPSCLKKLYPTLAQPASRPTPSN